MIRAFLSSGHAAVALVIFSVAPAAVLHAQDPNLCDVPGEEPDVLVGEIETAHLWGRVGDINGYSVGATACNIGTCQLNWVGNSALHPVFASNLYRLKDDRFSQIGQSWLKHGFAAWGDEICSQGCPNIHVLLGYLGPNCSDTYDSWTNGEQTLIGPRYDVDPSTGVFPYPFSHRGTTGDAIYKRMQVHVDDLTPALNPGARYFAEGQYLTRDDVEAGVQHNSASYREMIVHPAQLDLVAIDSTRQERAGIQAWRDIDPDVTETTVDVPGDGRMFVAAKATALGGGLYHYEYAVQNTSSRRAPVRFRVPIAASGSVSGLGFHDVDPHSGDLYSGTDWNGWHDLATNRIVWETTDGNPLRWGTLYNFWFDADVAPQPGQVELVVYLSGASSTVSGRSIIPDSCDHDGICQTADEDCVACAADCVHPGPPPVCCGDGGCEPGETRCVCPADCGAPATREVACTDGVDDDCDGRIDCSDDDCCAHVACRDLVDDDLDGVAECDCDDSDRTVWSTPGEVTGLVLSHAVLGGVTTLTWTPPSSVGGITLDYETLRSDAGSDWLSATCLSDVAPLDATNIDSANPEPGALFRYLVRAANDCPNGGGPTGSGSGGQARSARRCP